jgi:hypothetical protein
VVFNQGPRSPLSHPIAEAPGTPGCSHRLRGSHRRETRAPKWRLEERSGAESPIVERMSDVKTIRRQPATATGAAPSGGRAKRGVPTATAEAIRPSEPSATLGGAVVAR